MHENEKVNQCVHEAFAACWIRVEPQWSSINPALETIASFASHWKLYKRIRVTLFA